MLTGWTRVLDRDHWWGDRTARWAFWLSVAIAIGCAIPALFQAFSQPYVVQDDARQHVFWMRRWLNPALFANDPIADYFQSVAPWGYRSLYQIGAWFGLDPMVLNKCLPIGLGTISTVYCFRVVWQLLPVPLAALSACIFLNQLLWIADDLVSGVPVAFIYPLFLAFLDYWLRRSRWGTAGAIILMAGFYPHGVLLGASVVLLSGLTRAIASRFSQHPEARGLSPLSVTADRPLLPNVTAHSVTAESWRSRWLDWGDRPREKWWITYQFEITILLISAIALIPLLGKSASYGPILTAAEAKTAWAQFFDVKPAWAYWFKHRRTGMIPIDWWEVDFALPPIALTVLFFKFWWRRDRLPLIQATSPQIVVFGQLVIVSLIWFAIAHLFLFRLHLPNRYTEHSLRIIVAIVGAIHFSALVDWGWRKTRSSLTTTPSAPFRPLPRMIVILTSAIMLFAPFAIAGFPFTQYEIGQHPRLYEFLRQQPTEMIIASTIAETDNLPSFAQRSIVVGPGFTMRYHRRYATELLQRATDVLRAQYTTDPQVLAQTIARYQVDFWLLDRQDFNPDRLAKIGWVKWFRASADEPLAIAHRQAIAQLQRGELPVTQQRLDRCQRFTDDSLVVLEAKCLQNPDKT
ncbi:MAG: hypothetical protein EA001_09075 [Oscillatoriales cyanobacterium]|nr:MAG: hypothetical protein EA001_09075 [Oscillatoriales cyanobacterium]